MPPFLHKKSAPNTKKMYHLNLRFAAHIVLTVSMDLGDHLLKNY
jgi:hypothetical protein